MFTGIVQAMGSVQALVPNPFGVRLVINRDGWSPAGGAALTHGDSICVSGVCLTLVAHTPRVLEFDDIAETLRKTTLGTLAPGGKVNLEPSLTAQAFMGGHFVQGHIDGVGTVAAVDASPSEWRIAIRPPADLVDYIIPKGSVAVDGVSMTVAAVRDGCFELALIPTTLKLTTLGLAQAGSTLNIETDIVSRTIVYHLRQMGITRPATPAADGPVTRELLRQAGFTG